MHLWTDGHPRYAHRRKDGRLRLYEGKVILYKTLSGARRSLPEGCQIVVMSGVSLEPAEMTDEERAVWHESEMLRHAEELRIVQERMRSK